MLGTDKVMWFLRDLIDTKYDFCLCLTNESVHLQAKNHEDHTTMSLTMVEAQMWDNIL